uniref:8.9 kDa family member n=1 Tax=Rhipicephalus appendiculatus TaxID=34631 RepID=A0A131YHE4_RHIAP
MHSTWPNVFICVVVLSIPVWIDGFGEYSVVPVPVGNDSCLYHNLTAQNRNYTALETPCILIWCNVSSKTVILKGCPPDAPPVREKNETQWPFCCERKWRSSRR